MERAAIGYTIVEVMIVLAITSILFFSAITVFGSQRGSTDFSQAMQDLNSKIQNYANTVQTSSFHGSENFTCSVASDRALLVSGSCSGSQCIFLGLAVLALPNQDSLQTYTILGNKNVWSGGDSGTAATSIYGSGSANPEPAIIGSGSGSTYVLTDTYKLSAGATFKSAKASGTDYDLLGMYNGLPNDKLSNSQGTGALVLFGYPCNAAGCGAATPGTGLLKSCIEGFAPCASLSKLTQPWTLCVQDGGSNNTALVTVSGAPGGLTTNLDFSSC